MASLTTLKSGHLIQASSHLIQVDQKYTLFKKRIGQPDYSNAISNN